MQSTLVQLFLLAQQAGGGGAHDQPGLAGLYERLGVRLTHADIAGESFYNGMLVLTLAELEHDPALLEGLLPPFRELLRRYRQGGPATRRA